MMTPLAFIEGLLSPMHLVILLGIGFLVFGKRMPELGRTLAAGIKEFKRGMSGLEDDLGTEPIAHAAADVGADPAPARVVPQRLPLRNSRTPAAGDAARQRLSASL